MLTALLAGLGLGLSLIVAIGAQNLFVLRQGIRREHVLLVATICAVSDAVLIVAGVTGLGLVLESIPWLVPVVRWAGAIFLAVYGLMAARRAWRPTGEVLDGRSPGAPGPTPAPARSPGTTTVRTGSRRAAVVLACLALTWLNPHVYLDTVFLLGSIAGTHGDDRGWFAVGAVTGSILWFFGLAFGARLLSRVLATPRAWRVLDAIVAVVMIALAISLVVG
ncbi:LysE/ArgO family amino acid transporter [Microbacterium radiodurans]|uniref:Amino acid transporter n=1 Tax=Microbacterium radiodurans TaxID=661398 RepID=A0A5J5IYS2_9MICO|nr:LysE/ArgO family amino acid transporter [Microbacterium radiodurans]KAA9089882.1 amino acid transporter [Microbacterium radiodurans]